MFGRFLLNQKIITNDQLTEALNSQIIFGGRLGTNLIESGALKEEDLEKYLSLYHRLQPVPVEKTLNIPSNTLKLIPLNVVKKLKVIPFELSDKQLKVILMDPGRLDVIDELSFVTGLNIKPYVVPETRFLLLLEKYYRIKRDIRYITLSRQDTEQYLTDRLNKKPGPQQGPQAEKTGQPDEQTTRQETAGAPFRPLANNEELTTEEDFQKMLKTQQVHTEPAESPIELSHAMELEQELTLIHPSDLPAASAILAEANSRDDIAAVVLGYALSVFKRVAIFLIQKRLAIGWEGAGTGVNRFNIKQLVIPLDQPSVFKFVNDTGAHFIGPPQDAELNRDFFLLLGGKPPRTVAIIPIHFKGKLVQMLYGDSGEDEFASVNIGELLILLQKVPEIIETLVTRKRGNL